MLDDSDENEIDESIIEIELLQLKPIKPSEEACCGNGCKLCVFDIYNQEMIMWKDECRNHISGVLQNQSNNSIVLNPTHYNTFQLTKITPISSDTNLYKFSIPSGLSLGGTAVQHLIARGYVKDQRVTRQYTPISKLEDKGYFVVLIKIYKEGLMSEYVETWNLGSMVEWRGPFTQFIYDSNQYRSILMLAAGTGIAPMVQIIRAILENEEDNTRVNLVFSYPNYKDILMKSFLDKCKEYWNFNILYCLSQENNQNEIKYGERVIFGRINDTILKEKLSEISDIDNNVVLICGPKVFNNDMKIACQRLEIKSHNIFLF